MKTIFLAISRGLLARNILRCGTLDHLLANKDTRVVLLLPRNKNGIPEYLRKEFSHPQIVLEEVPERRDGPFYNRIWQPFIYNLVYTEFTDMLAREGSGKVKPVARWWYPIHRRVFGFLSTSERLKALARRMDYFLFRGRRLDPLFEKYHPEAVFCGSIISKYDIVIMKAAKRHGVRVVGMQKGWDNLQKVLIRHVPDQFAVQNALMIDIGNKIQKIPRETFALTGFPQFDTHYQINHTHTQTQARSALGLPEDKKLIFFGSEGTWSYLDDQIFERILALKDQGAFPFDTYFIARPHFSDVAKGRFERFRSRPDVRVMDEYRRSVYFDDYWDPDINDYRSLSMALRASDVLVTYASTLVLDAACHNVPAVGITYGSCMKNGVDITRNLYKADHFIPVVESGALALAGDEQELVQRMIDSIQIDGYLNAERERLRQTMCGPLEGTASAKLAKLISEGHTA